ncbi:MAG: hypothetical protein ACXQTE_04150, partial [Methanosarcinaceae archaeon]
ISTSLTIEYKRKGTERHSRSPSQHQIVNKKRETNSRELLIGITVVIYSFVVLLFHSEIVGIDVRS